MLCDIPSNLVGPYLLRHSRATHLANHLTEAQMNAVLGWVQGSNMPAVYVHLSGRDVDRALLAAHGIEEESREAKEEDTALKPIPCPRCKTVNPAGALYCSAGSLALSVKAVELIEEDKTGLIKRVEELEAKATQVTDWQKAGEALFRGMSTHPGFAEAIKKAMAELPEHPRTEKDA